MMVAIDIYTSSGPAIVRTETPTVIDVIWTLFTIGNTMPTATSASYAKEVPLAQTDTGGNVHSQIVPIADTAASIMEIRMLSGLTWEELGDLFSVSRRSVHNWASGEVIAAKHERHVFEALGALRQLDCGEAAQTRRFLLSPTATGRSVFDLLRNGKLAEALAYRPAPARHQPQRLPLAMAEQSKRTPSSVTSYLDATEGAPTTPSRKPRATARPRRTI